MGACFRSVSILPPLEYLQGMEDCRVVLEHFPNSNRVLAKSFYIGHLSESEWEDFIDTYLRTVLGVEYEVYDRENEYTHSIGVDNV